jgi:hypothetical protein
MSSYGYPGRTQLKKAGVGLVMILNDAPDMPDVSSIGDNPRKMEGNQFIKKNDQ